MRNWKFVSLFLGIISLLYSCQNKEATAVTTWDENKNIIVDASGLDIYQYEDFSAILIHDPWPNATEKFQYIAARDLSKIPDSLKKYPAIQIPIQRAIATSTTHIPSFEYLNVLDQLVGFPNTNYISSQAAIEYIKAGKIKDLGAIDKLEVETVLSLQPQIIIAHGIDNNNARFDLFKNNGITVLYNGDWNDNSPLGKAEWIKFFGELFDKQELATQWYNQVKKEFHQSAQQLAEKVKNRPTVLSGSMYKNVWYAPSGESWAAEYLAMAGGDYIWKHTKGTGSLNLHFEEVLSKAQKADFWITSSSYTTIDELLESYPHYNRFDAVKQKKVYGFSQKNNSTGGILFYELANSRPDLVLKDLIKILHPELESTHELVFYQAIP